MVYFLIHAEGETQRRPLKGKPGSGPERRETVASASPGQRETGGSGITRRRGETQGEGFPPPAGKPVGDGTRLSERGSFGIVERSTGRRSHDLHSLRKRRERRRTATAFGPRWRPRRKRCGLRFAAPRTELGPRPDNERARVPRGLRLRSRLPRDFLVLGLAQCISLRRHELPREIAQ
jgi:hypothetical protein